MLCVSIQINIHTLTKLLLTKQKYKIDKTVNVFLHLKQNEFHWW